VVRYSGAEWASFTGLLESGIAALYPRLSGRAVAASGGHLAGDFEAAGE